MSYFDPTNLTSTELLKDYTATTSRLEHTCGREWTASDDEDRKRQRALSEEVARRLDHYDAQHDRISRVRVSDEDTASKLVDLLDMLGTPVVGYGEDDAIHVVVPDGTDPHTHQTTLGALAVALQAALDIGLITEA